MSSSGKRAIRDAVFEATRTQCGYVKPENREHCGRCLSRQDHVTESGTKTTTSFCARYMFAVQKQGWCLRFRSVP